MTVQFISYLKLTTISSGILSVPSNIERDISCSVLVCLPADGKLGKLLWPGEAKAQVGIMPILVISGHLNFNHFLSMSTFHLHLFPFFNIKQIFTL